MLCQIFAQSHVSGHSQLASKSQAKVSQAHGLALAWPTLLGLAWPLASRPSQHIIICLLPPRSNRIQYATLAILISTLASLESSRQSKAELCHRHGFIACILWVCH